MHKYFDVLGDIGISYRGHTLYLYLKLIRGLETFTFFLAQSVTENSTLGNFEECYVFTANLSQFGVFCSKCGKNPMIISKVLSINQLHSGKAAFKVYLIRKKPFTDL